MEHAPVVSICLITYNHAPFIRQALDGILAQEMTWSWELIIADDCSTDGTRDIVIDYQRRYPSSIRLILQPSNVGAAKNWHMLLNAASGEFIAYCEGDDYWLDPRKLARQVGFLEAHPDYVLCFTRGIIENAFLDTRREFPQAPESQDFAIGDFIASNDQLSPTCVYRVLPQVREVPVRLMQYPYGDLALYIWLLDETGLKARRLGDVTAVYRVHAAGVYGSLTRSPATMIRAFEDHVAFYLTLRKHLTASIYARDITRALTQRFETLSGLHLQTHRYGPALRNVFRCLRHTGDRSAAFYYFKQLVKTMLIDAIEPFRRWQQELRHRH